MKLCDLAPLREIVARKGTKTQNLLKFVFGIRFR
jgi:hypothetical protein